jgi:hypothetical protein
VSGEMELTNEQTLLSRVFVEELIFAVLVKKFMRLLTSVLTIERC